jgi:murein L,D-transpeptidase YcbB/YkuD
MRFIEFSPYWNVPPSIAREETVPRLRRDSAYFTQQGFEFVNSSGQAVTDLSQDHLNAVMQGTMRIRQRPGPRTRWGTSSSCSRTNATSTCTTRRHPALCARARDFSHGCIRVETPWPWPASCCRTTRPGRSASARPWAREVAHHAPAPAHAGGAGLRHRHRQERRPHFFADIYGQDKLLDQPCAATPRHGARPAERYLTP